MKNYFEEVAEMCNKGTCKGKVEHILYLAYVYAISQGLEAFDDLEFVSVGAAIEVAESSPEFPSVDKYYRQKLFERNGAEKKEYVSLLSDEEKKAVKWAVSNFRHLPSHEFSPVIRKFYSSNLEGLPIPSYQDLDNHKAYGRGPALVATIDRDAVKKFYDDGEINYLTVEARCRMITECRSGFGNNY